MTAPTTDLPDLPRSHPRIKVAFLALGFILTLALVVREVFLAPPERPLGGSVRRPLTVQTRYETGDRDLDALQGLLRPTLEANRKQMAGRLGRVQGFGAGEAYPQIWVRDGATILHLSRWLYPREELVSWIEELLAAQQPDGAIVDWIAYGEPRRFRQWAPRARAVAGEGSATITADTNTTEADQETSLVHAVHTACQAMGEIGWLKGDILGKTVIERAEGALASLATRRRDPATGLITSAFTADWGDVSPLYPDQRAIYLDDRTPVVVGLYTNALYCRAASDMADLLESIGERGRAGTWRDEAGRIRDAVNRHLWQERRGFYRMHRVVTAQPLERLPDDGHIFAMGGHAVALLAGIADERRAAEIIENAERLRKEYGLPTVAASLLPPFPAGTFAHAAMREEWRYQNGGQWDWFAGRFVLAEFRLGHSERALQHLTALARRVRAAGGLYEWYERDGTGRGSPRYAASAAALAQAVFGGLFGITLDARGASVEVRLGGRDGAVTVHEPASGRTLAYTQRIEGAGARLVLTYAGRVEGIGRLRVRLPSGSSPGSVRNDGAPTVTVTERTGKDTFVALDTDWRTHRIEIELLAGGEARTGG
jgi:hypothetical protein